MPTNAKERIKHLTESSVRTLVASEKAVERAALRQFQDARLFASLAIGLLLVGFLLVAQWRGVETYEVDLETQSDQELALIVSELAGENEELRRESMRLEQRVREVEETEAGQREVLNEAARELQALRVLTGLEAAVGPGVSVRIADPAGVLVTRDLVDLTNELRAAGAEAMSIDGVRVGMSSGFSEVDGVPHLDGEPIEGDVVVFAIGSPALLRQAFEMPGGIGARLGSFPGVEVTILERERVVVPPATIREFEYGSVVES
jgi:uncharacterized protein YlxW (UPF0749 family)